MQNNASTCGMLETQEFFFMTYLTHTTTYVYLPKLMSSWNLREFPAILRFRDTKPNLPSFDLNF